MRRLAYVLIAILILIPVIGCASPKLPVPAGETSEPSVPGEETLAEPTKVTTIDIGWPMSKNWDADPEVDGIEFDLTPKDAEDKMVETLGVVSAKLWLEKSFLEGGGKGDLVQEWSNIQVTKNDYDWVWGVTIRLEYKGFEPEEMQFGIFEVTLVTPDGKSFTARESSVMLAK